MAFDPSTGLPLDENGNPIIPEIGTLPWQTGEVPDRDPDEFHPAADVPMPGETAPPKGSYQGPKVAVATRGITEAGTRKARGFYGEADARAAGRIGDDAAVSGHQIDQSRENYSAVGESLDQAVEATKRFQERENELQTQLGDFHRGAGELEQRLAGEAQAERAQYVAAYKEQLAVVKQLSMQTGNPIGNMTQGEAIGLAGAQFAQGFLAAQGIQIDVAGQVDRWVERSIQEHQLRIQGARATADDQMHLYEISRQNSADEWEARQRYRGFVIAGLQTAIHLNASRFQSDIAMARAGEQIARLQIEADATERSIADAHFNRANQIYASEYQRAYQMGSLSIESRKAQLEADKFAWDKSPQNPKNKPKPGDVPVMREVFIDPEGLKNPDGTPMLDDKGNRAFRQRWRVKGGIDEARARDIGKEAQAQTGSYAQFVAATERLQGSYLEAKAIRDAMPTVGKLTWETLARMDDTKTVERFLQDRRAWVIAKVKSDSGMAVTDKERQFHEEQAYLDKLLARDDGTGGEKLYANLSEAGRLTFESRMTALGLEPVDESDPEAITWKPPAAPRTSAQNAGTIHGKEPDAGFAEKQLGKAVARGAHEVETKNVSGSWADFQKDVQIPAGEKIKLGQPEYAVVVDHLAAAYAKPRYFRVHSTQWGVKVDKDETPLEIRTGAYKALSSLAIGHSPDGREVPGELIQYAGHVKKAIDADPVLSKAMETDEDITESPFIERLTWRPKQ